MPFKNPFFCTQLNFFVNRIFCLLVPVCVRSMSTNKHSGYRCWAKNNKRGQCGFASIVSSKDDETKRADPLTDLCQVHRDLAAKDIDSVAWYNEPTYFWPKPQDHLKQTPAKPLPDPTEINDIDDLEHYEQKAIAAIKNIDEISLEDEFSQADYVPTPDATPVPIHSKVDNPFTNKPIIEDPPTNEDPPAEHYFLREDILRSLDKDFHWMFTNPITTVCIDHLNNKCRRGNKCFRIHINNTDPGKNGRDLCAENIFNTNGCKDNHCRMIHASAVKLQVAWANGNKELCDLRQIEGAIPHPIRTGRHNQLNPKERRERSPRPHRSRSPRKRRSRSPRSRGTNQPSSSSHTNIVVSQNSGHINVNHINAANQSPQEKRLRNLLDAPLDQIPAKKFFKDQAYKDKASTYKDQAPSKTKTVLLTPYEAFVKNNEGKGKEVLERIFNHAGRRQEHDQRRKI